MDRRLITQTVIGGNIVGDLPISLPGGAIGFAAGAEWRRETSRFESDPWDRGILPEGSPYGANNYVGDFSNNKSLGFSGGDSVSNNSSGRYDVVDIYAEARLPILSDLAFADDLSVDLAYRYSDYSTVGSTDTWRVGAVYAPIPDLRLRGSISQSVRAPNINELFSPVSPAFYRPTDPCGVSQRNALTAEDPVAGALREANCTALLSALGMSPAQISGFTGTLSARFPGTTAGNPNLREETSDAITYGFVVQPSFLPGLSFSLDYWSMELEDPINLLGQQDVVDNCVDSASIANDYCAMIVRSNVAGPTLGLLTGLNLTVTNLMAIEAEGFDLSARYAFDWGDHNFTISLLATQQKKLDFYYDPLDSSAVDPELGEFGRPEWSGILSLGWSWGPAHVGWRSQYVGEQLIGGGGIVQGAEIENYMTQYGSIAMGDAIILHDLSARFDITERTTIYGGINNITDEQPYPTSTSYPASARGQFFYMGVTARF